MSDERTELLLLQQEMDSLRQTVGAYQSQVINSLLDLKVLMEDGDFEDAYDMILELTGENE